MFQFESNPQSVGYEEVSFPFSQNVFFLTFSFFLFFFVCNYGTLNSVDSCKSTVQYSRSNFVFCSSLRYLHMLLVILNRKVFKGSLDKRWLQEWANLIFLKVIPGLFVIKIGFIGNDQIPITSLPQTPLFLLSGLI